MQEYCDACGKSIFGYNDKHEIKWYEKDYILCGLCYKKYSDIPNKDEFMKTQVIDKSRIRDENLKEQLKKQQFEKERLDNMILTTSFAIDNHKVTAYKGIIGSQVMAGINFFKDIFAGFRNVFGGRSKALQGSMRKMREQALEELKEEAFQKGANAVIGIKLDFDEYGGQMLMLTASGTAVVIE